MLRHKKLFGILAAAALAMLLGGCGGPEDSEFSAGRADTVLREQYSEIEEGSDPAAADSQAEEDTVTSADISSEENSAAPETPQDSNLPVAVSLPGKNILWMVYSEGVYCYRSGLLYGYLAEDGSEITPCVYSEAAPFSEGLACVCLDGKYGFIDKEGDTILPFIYDQASSFREGRAYFSCGEEYGLIDREGNVAARLEGCESISAFREGLAYFCADGHYGYMNQSGQVVVEPVYDDAGYFYDGLAVVRKSGLCGVIGKDGGEILPLCYMTVVLKENGIIAQREGMYYCFDREGRELLDGAWDSIWEEDGIFHASRGDRDILADRDGKVLFEETDSPYCPNMIPGRELIRLENAEERWGILDFDGQIVVPFQYGYIGYEADEVGFRYRDWKTGKEGYLDGEDFSVKISAIYDFIGEFYEGRAVVIQDGKYGILRSDGTLELACEYDGIALFDDGSTTIREGGNVKLTDKQGNRILIGEYKSVGKVGNGYEAQSWEDNGYSYWDGQGNLVVSGYRYRRTHSVVGTSKAYILDGNTLLITQRESGQNIEEVFLRNWLTPEAGLFADSLTNGTFTAGDMLRQSFNAEGDERVWRSFNKLYRVGEDMVLYFYSEPEEQCGIRESCSGLFTVRDGQIVQLLVGSECGGTAGGEQVCFAYDREEDTWKPGVRGGYGGFGGYAFVGEVYVLQEGEAAREVSFSCCEQSMMNYEEEELLDNAGLFYDYEDVPYTEETIMEAAYVTEYSIDDRQVPVERYRKTSERYQFFMPLDLWR